MSDRYPTLALMGITNPDQIQSYTLSTIEPHTDLLRITYRRPSGSLLPTTRKYDFDRTARAADPSSTFGGELQTYEISPVLNKALLELETIVNVSGAKETLADDILRQLDELERDFVAELAALRTKIRKLGTA